MDASVRINQCQIDGEAVARLTRAAGQPVSVNKTVASEPVVVKDALLGKLEINSARFKAGLAFINCEFTGDVEIKNVVSGTSISFINCVFRGDFEGFRLNAQDSVSLIKSRFSGAIRLDGATAGKLDLQQVHCRELKVASKEAASNLARIALSHLNCASFATLDSIAGIGELEVDELIAPSLALQRLRFEAGNAVVQRIRTDGLILEAADFRGCRVRVQSSTVDRLHVIRCDLSDARVQLEQVIVPRNIAFLRCKYDEQTTIDLSEATLSTMDFDDELIRFLRKPDAGSALLHPSLAAGARLGTLKLLKDKFAQEHQYELEDRVFYLLKSLESSMAAAEAPRLGKPRVWLSRVLYQYVLGWGVRLGNPLLTSLVLVELFALAHYLSLRLYDGTQSVTYLGQTLHGVFAAHLVSVLAFFGQYGDVGSSGDPLIPVLLLEFVAGIVMTTVVVGIIIRKLTR